jgi:predicted phosphodiesterase
MRILVISDIHANLEALQIVLEDAGKVDQVWCLGDLVGYGPDPNGCVELIRSQPNSICVKGNHDVAALGEINISLFNQEAKESMIWHQSVLSPENKEYLKSLPEKFESDSITLAHGSPRNPIWEYILDPYVARINYEYFQTALCFVGHSHQPVISSWDSKNGVLEWGSAQQDAVVSVHDRMIINPGSVGQPRDSDSRAAYGIYKTDVKKFEFHRVAYNISAVQSKIMDLRLPFRHAQRLSGGW